MLIGLELIKCHSFQLPKADSETGFLHAKVLAKITLYRLFSNPQ